jgi:pyruvate dehydrogenase E1 component beta subunit
MEDGDTYRLLKSAPQRVCAPDVPVPFSPPMEQFVAPDKAKLIAAVRRAMG